MSTTSVTHWRRLLPWFVSAGALAYVFGWATDWRALLAATREANLVLFAIVTTADKVVFFLVWTYLQAIAVQRFVTPVSFRKVLAIRGGSELLRAVSNPLADAAFFMGLAQLSKGRLEAVLAAGLIPFMSHLVVMLVQASLALPFLEGGPAGNRDVALAAGIGWAAVATAGVVLRFGSSLRIPGVQRAASWLDRLPLRRMAPFFWWFVALAVFDVLVQGLASRAFGVPIAWLALAGRIPILYAGLSIPSFGNFGTRELTWAALFEEFGPRDTLIAYAFATNSLFLLLNVVIGILFLPRAIDLVMEMRRAQRAGEEVPEPLLHDASDP